MKKIKNIFIVGAVFLALFSCREEFLKEEPQTTVTLASAITNEATLKVAVNGLYNYMQTTGTLMVSSGEVSQNSFAALIPTLNELLGDTGFVSLSNSNRFATTRNTDLTFFTKENADIGVLWNSLYRTISYANFILANQGKIADDSTTSETPQNLFAQAYLVRAMCYHQLVGWFSDAYGASNQDLGVPVLVEFDVSAKKPRATVQQVYDQILSDLKNAEGAINDVANSLALNKASVDLMFSRYYLSVKNYALADAYSQKVLNNSKFTLLPSSSIADFFKVAGEANKETIFQIEFNSKDLPGANDGITATWFSGGRYKQNYMTRAFYNTMASDDVRREVWYKSTVSSVNALPDAPKPIDVQKYTTADRDIIVFRKTEAVFNQLEALYYTDPTSALAKLNTWVKTYRIPSYAFSGNGQALLMEILKQKNYEFFLEGFRFQDLKRNKISIVNPQTGVSIGNNTIQFQAFPIPLGEMQSNPNIKQYPGYR